MFPGLMLYFLLYLPGENFKCAELQQQRPVKHAIYTREPTQYPFVRPDNPFYPPYK